MNIEIVRWSYGKQIDYVQISLRCTICKSYGHLKRAFPKKIEPAEDLEEEKEVFQVQKEIPKESTYRIEVQGLPMKGKESIEIKIGR